MSKHCIKKSLLVLTVLILINLVSSFFKLGAIFSSSNNKTHLNMSNNNKYPIYCEEDVMKPKAHGTCDQPVMKKLRWGCNWDTADRICCFNRHYAEHAGYWESTTFISDHSNSNNEITFYDSVTGKPLFIAPKGRTFEEFRKESKSHGWPSFRDQEVVWENVRCLTNGEAVSVDGTHLGHNLPDRKGNRYCINLVSVAGVPLDGSDP
mmetsp:Transcript_96898/g.273898  ORF Transcript_96898/g.273898 Transcript_96898/m.273898 type:complete len:207 (+) Transcript_96898:40-660(+)